jgi:L-ornithine N5-oxygenase
MTDRPDVQTTAPAPEPVDVLGVGFGPANLSLAIALQEDLPQAGAFFLQAAPNPV